MLAVTRTFVIRRASSATATPGTVVRLPTPTYDTRASPSDGESCIGKRSPLCGPCHHGLESTSPMMFRINRALLSGEMMIGADRNGSASLFTLAYASVTLSWPRLYTVSVTGIESPNARSSCGAVASMATPAASNAASAVRFEKMVSEASRSRAAASHAPPRIAPSSLIRPIIIWPV